MAVDLLDLTTELKDLALRAARPTNVDELLEQALDSLSEIIPYDLAAVLELEQDQLRVRCARGRLVDGRVRAHQIALADFPSVREALSTGHARVLSEADHASHGGDPYGGVLDLPAGHSCMVVPLIAGADSLGVLTFDRVECDSYARAAINVAEIYAQILALAIQAARQAQLLDRYRQQLQEEKRLLLEEVTGPSQAGRLIESARSRAMSRVVMLARQVAMTDAPVLITGETGTGKEVLAGAIHDWSRRRGKAFIKINCAALPEPLLESELFGHTRGAFSGATTDRPGRFAIANGGTLLLDEIGELPPGAQAKLLRVLQEGCFEPVGSDRSVKVDVRILAATHVDLEQAIAEGRFREDLYYRLNLFPIPLPALRERREDIPRIAEDFLTGLKQRTGRGPWTLDSETLRALSERDWPGNVRELLNVLERATILQPTGKLALSLSQRASRRREPLPEAGGPDRCWPSLAEFERDYIRKVLDKTRGKIYGPGGAAELLDLKPSTLQSRMARLGVPRIAK